MTDLMEDFMNISKILVLALVISCSVGVGRTQSARQPSVTSGHGQNGIAVTANQRNAAWVLNGSATVGGPAEETTAGRSGGVTYFESGKVDETFSKGGVLFDGDHGALNYKIVAGRRVVPGQVETHLKDTDVIYVLQGAATFVTGGASLDDKSTAPNELLGASIKGGETWRLKKGDVIIVPKGTPHWFKKVDQGPFLYFIVKVR
jgi:glc operon protein GlcG